MTNPSKARVPVQKRGIETKAKVVAAARALFIEKGYYKTHALEIAARAGVATGTFYAYFNDKKEVLIELIRQFYQQGLDEALAGAEELLSSSADGRKIIHNLIKILHDLHASQADLHRVMFPLIFLIPEAMEISRKEEKAVIRAIAAYFKQHQSIIRVTDLQAAAEIAFKVSDEIIHRILFWGSESDGEKLILELEDMLYHYLISAEPGPLQT